MSTTVEALVSSLCGWFDGLFPDPERRERFELAYVADGSLAPDTAFALLRGSRTVVLDLRRNGGGDPGTAIEAR